ncbi:MAG: alternative ribosome rescue aminoacyl-tRNA hydrolase ArfB [Acidimicrobiales bacterium]|nr:alternative ribosome rescue aminoacyl-tRNA hydrolase ArfB [Acidimicrobiales bacterium]MDG2216656.1 alternative ribosome rescue aminoacyl-tRNA hydrolase ArfB [Acidimicrobiales bacterium]
MYRAPEAGMTVGWEIPEAEIDFRFVASGGPGGQHANRSNTKVDATFDIAGSPSMPEGLRQRVMERLGQTVRATVDDERSQLRNRQIAIERLRGRVAAAGKVERPRRATKPTRGSKKRRVEAKRQRSDLKRGRQKPGRDD